MADGSVMFTLRNVSYDINGVVAQCVDSLMTSVFVAIIVIAERELLQPLYMAANLPHLLLLSQLVPKDSLPVVVLGQSALMTVISVIFKSTAWMEVMKWIVVRNKCMSRQQLLAY